jgi:hypothetical protein
MDISRQEAQDSLKEIEAVSLDTRKTLVASYASGLLILWGLIWIVAFVGTHLYLRGAGLIWKAFCSIGGIGTLWMFFNVMGCIGTIVICRRQMHLANPTRIASAKKVGWRIFWFWTLLSVHVGVWLSILKPYSGLQMNAFICTVGTFAYIVIGLWFESYFMVWLGLAVTGITLVAFYILPHSYYNLWMAAAGGGTIAGTGFYIRFYWK